MDTKDFALYLDPPAGSAGAPAFRRVVPLPDSNQGQISIIYDNFGTSGLTPVGVKVRINGVLQSPDLMISSPGKTPVHSLSSGDTVASFDVTPPTDSSGNIVRPSLAVLVEYQ